MRITLKRTAAGLVLAFAFSISVTASGQDQSVTEVEEVVVTARRIGVPVWRVGDADSAIIFVGGIGAVPTDVAWRSSELEEAIRGSRKLIHTASVQAGLMDMYRLRFGRGRWTDLPHGQSPDARIGPDLRERLSRLAAAGQLPPDYDQLRPWYIAHRLRGALVRQNGGEGATALAVALRAARRNRVPIEPALAAPFRAATAEMSKQRTSDIACLEASVGSAEAGVSMLRDRAAAWTRSRVSEVLGSPLSKAEAFCWPQSDADLGPVLREAWRDVTRRELALPGAVVAVAPLRFLAEPGGLLDELEAQGFEVEGPRWREKLP